MSESENTVVSFGRDPNTIKRLREERAEFEKWGQTLSALERLQSKKLDLRFPRWRAFARG